MANWNNPTNLSLYTAYTSELDGRLDDLALGLDPATTTVTSPPTNSIRWNSATSIWEKFNGTSWAALSSLYAINISGNSGTSTKLATARAINGVNFDGSAAITITANTPQSLTFNNAGSGATSGSTFDGSTARTISFNTVGAPSTTGTNASGTWGISITGSAPTLTTARNINGVGFNGSADVIVEPYVEDDETSDAARFLVFVDNSTAGYKRLNEDSGLSYNPNSGTLTATGFAGALSGNATTATTLATARTINGVSFNGSANITITANNPNALTLSTTGDGAAGTTTYDGSTARIISYNSIGAPSAAGVGASGTWAISISGNAATATTASSVTNGVYTTGDQTISGTKTFVNATNSIVNSTGLGGFGAFYAAGSGTGSAFYFYGNGSGERSRTWSDDSRVWRVSNNNGTTTHLSLDASGNLSNTGTFTAGGNISTSGTVTSTGNMTSSGTMRAASFVLTDGSSPVSTSTVLSATSAAGVGAVGSYAFMSCEENVALAEGTLKAGSVLRYRAAQTEGGRFGSGNYVITNRGSAASGTWRLMGYVSASFEYYGDNVNNYNTCSLWLRIS